MVGLSCHMWDLVPWQGIEPGPPALGAQNLSHWITREVHIAPFHQKPFRKGEGGRTYICTYSRSPPPWNLCLEVTGLCPQCPSIRAALRDAYPWPLAFVPGSEELDELHYQDTDSDVPEQRDSRCKVKWTQEEVSDAEGQLRRGGGEGRLRTGPGLCLPDAPTSMMKAGRCWKKPVALCFSLMLLRAFLEPVGIEDSKRDASLRTSSCALRELRVLHPELWSCCLSCNCWEVPNLPPPTSLSFRNIIIVLCL